MTIRQAAKRLGIGERYTCDLARSIGAQFPLTPSQVKAIAAERVRRRKAAADSRALRFRAMNASANTPEKARGAALALGVKRRRRALEQALDYFGEPVAFAFSPGAAEDEGLSSPNYGPAMATLQFRPFYPRLDGELIPWRKLGNDGLPVASLSESAMFLDRCSVRLWQERARN